MKEKHKATAFLFFSVYNVFMVCYLDIYFLENFIIDFIILFCTAKIRHIKIKWKRIILASIIGSILSIAVFVLTAKINIKLNSKAEMFFSAILKFAISILMTSIAFKEKNKMLQEKSESGFKLFDKAENKFELNKFKINKEDKIKTNKAENKIKRNNRNEIKKIQLKRKIIEKIKTLIIFYLVAFVISGIQTAILFGNSFEIITAKNVLKKIKMSQGNLLKTSIIAGIIGLCLAIFAFMNNKEKIKKEDLICNLLITIGFKTIKLKALLDTGNSLKYKELNVIIVEKSKLFSDEEFEKLFMKEGDTNEDDFCKYNLEQLEQSNYKEKIKKANLKIKNETGIETKNYKTRLKLIPFKSIGNSNGVLIGIIPDKVILEFNEVIFKENLIYKQSKKNKNVKQRNFENEKAVELENIILGIYDKKIGTKYSAIIGLDAVRKGN